MMLTTLKLLKCRWLIFQNVVHLRTLKKPQIFKNLNKTADVKRRGKFLSILCLTRMFYITYINKILDWDKNEEIRITFLQVGKLHLHKLYQNKHFSTSGMISPNSKRKIFSCSLTIILFNHLLGVLKCLLVSPCPTLHIISIAFFVCNSKAGIYA